MERLYNCFRSENLDVMRLDAQRLIRVVLSTGSTKDLIPHEGSEPVLLDRPPVGWSSSMAAACALHIDQAARSPRRPYVVREMLHRLVLHLPEPRDQYYMAEAHWVLGARAWSG